MVACRPPIQFSPMFWFRLFNLEDEGRVAFLKTLGETFDALGYGEQLNFLDAAGAELSLG